ncbi:MAG: hypothetical protein IKQ22_00780 [Clostridia bacterium]|nr:hypothetical protein [Clostridia bacterium]
MDILIISFCLVFLLLSFIVLSAVVIRLTNRVNLLGKLISGAWYNDLSKEEEEKEE